MRLFLLILIFFGGLSTSVSPNYSQEIQNSKVQNFNASTFSANHRTIINLTLTINALSNTSICEGDSVKLSTCHVSGNFFQWYLVVGGKSNTLMAIPGAINTTYYAKKYGDYLLISHDLNGMTYTSNTINIIVNPSPLVSILTNGNLNFCPNENVILTASTTSFNSFLWSNGDTHQSIVVNTAGFFSVAVKNLKNGCSTISPTVSTLLHAFKTDINFDGITNYTDYLMLIQQFNTNCVNCREDIDSDGIVKNEDFLKLLGDYNRACN